MCGTANCIRSRCLWGLIHCITLELRSHVIQGPTNKLNLIQLAVPNTHVVFLLYMIYWHNLTFGGTQLTKYVRQCYISSKLLNDLQLIHWRYTSSNTPSDSVQAHVQDNHLYPILTSTCTLFWLFSSHMVLECSINKSELRNTNSI